MLQLLLEVYWPVGNSDSFDHCRNHLHGLPFQAWSYGAWLALLRHCSGDLPCTSPTSSSPADSSTSTIAGHTTACRLDCRCPDGPGSLSPAPSCPVAGLRLVTSFPFVIPQRVPFSGFRGVRVCRYCTCVGTHFQGQQWSTPSGLACTACMSSP